LHDAFPGVKFDLVLLDYFRFPSDYMHKAYDPLCTPAGFLATLIEKKMLSKNAQVFVPHLAHQEPFCAKFEKFETGKRGAKKHTVWDTMGATAENNPLATVTAQMNRELLGGYGNQKQLSLLQPDFPFTKVFV
jgi:hypothetical protein